MTHINLKNLVALALLVCITTGANARGFGGGGFHGGYNGGGFHGGGYDGYHNDNYHAAWHDNYWNGSVNTGVIMTAPTVGYYGPACQNTQVCNSYGQCWTEQNCDN